VRIAAAMACLRAGDNPKAVEILKSALADPSETVRLEAGNAVDRLGGKARLFSAELAAALKDPRNKTTYVPRVTNRILNRINGTNNEVR
jgi:HEAT repeat protein